MTEKQSPLQTQYQHDADLMSTKSRFGFFSILPSHTAAITDYAQKQAHKDENGKVKIQPRGIYSGSKSAKVLNKTVFSQIKSPFIGCPYVDPGKPQRQRLLQQKKKWQNKQLFKPARLQKTLVSSAYPYKSMKPEDKTKKYRNEDGKVITQSPNICANTLSKLQFERGKGFKYVEDPYDNLKKMRKQQLDEDLRKRGEPFKSGNPVKEVFFNNKKVYDDTSSIVKAQKPEVAENAQTKPEESIKHEYNFRPSSGQFTKYNGLFNPITYKQEGKPKQRPKTADKISTQSETFKSMNKPKNSRPCPSISTNKMNLMRSFR